MPALDPARAARTRARRSRRRNPALVLRIETRKMIRGPHTSPGGRRLQFPARRANESLVRWTGVVRGLVPHAAPIDLLSPVRRAPYAAADDSGARAQDRDEEHDCSPHTQGRRRRSDFFARCSNPSCARSGLKRSNDLTPPSRAGAGVREVQERSLESQLSAARPASHVVAEKGGVTLHPGGKAPIRGGPEPGGAPAHRT